MPYNKAFEGTLYDRNWMVEHYVNQSMNAAQVALVAGCTTSAVHGQLRRHGIPLKTSSEAQRLRLVSYGSSAPRPRGQFLATLHDKDWMTEHYVHKHMSLTEISKLAECSVAAVSKAVNAHGLARHGSQRTVSFVRQKELVRRKAKVGIMRHYTIARELCPPAPCEVCGVEYAKDVNHKDRNPANNARSNLERICGSCHVRQHRLEDAIAREWWIDSGKTMDEMHDIARLRLREKLLVVSAGRLPEDAE